MEAVGFSEVLVPTYQTTYHLILEDLCYYSQPWESQILYIICCSSWRCRENCEECQDSAVHPEIYTGLIPNASQKHYFCC